jgi:hypothetical protein
MRLATVQGVYALESSFEERSVPKQAGFRWHGGGSWCENGRCGACKAGLGKVWWIDDPTAAARANEYEFHKDGRRFVL